MQALTRVLKHLPLHTQANSRLGMLLMQSGKFEQASSYLHTACQAQPKVRFHWLRLLAAHQQAGNIQQAKQVLEQAAQYQWSPEVMEQLAKVAFEPTAQRQQWLLAKYQTGQDLLTVEIAAQFFIDDYPEHPLGWQILGALLHDTGRLAESLDVRQKTIEFFPNDANSHNNLAHILLALKRYKEALASAKTALKLNPILEQASAHIREALAGLKTTELKASVSTE